VIRFHSLTRADANGSPGRILSHHWSGAGTASGASFAAKVIQKLLTGSRLMSYLKVGYENSAKIRLYFEDQGSGNPVVLIHGWPLSSRSWEKQVPALLKAGYRVITYDRRGFGDSDRPASGYDYDTLAGDLNAVLNELELNQVTLVGFSMGGGEVARYLDKYDTSRIKKVVFVSAITPDLLKSGDNPEGIDRSVFEQIKQSIMADRPAFLTRFLDNFYNLNELKGKRISDEVVRLSWMIAAGASPIGTLTCVDSWLTDFRKDLQNVTIPTLIVHGDSDRIIPLENSAKRMPGLMKNAHLAVIPGGPHGLNWTHAELLNQELLAFLGAQVSRPEQQRAAS
jgi:non-heme chloroperoxidase